MLKQLNFGYFSQMGEKRSEVGQPVVRRCSPQQLLPAFSPPTVLDLSKDDAASETSDDSDSDTN